MIKIFKKKGRKNPYDTSNFALNLLPNIEFKELSDEGQFAQTYKFVFNSETRIFDKLLNKGDYVLKIYRNNYNLNEDQISYLLKLSNLKLIPKIYIITDKFIIMKFIHGKLFYEYIKNITYKEFDILMNRLKNVIYEWNKVGYEHGDLSSRNIIIDHNNNINLIDPDFHTISYRKFIGDSLKYRTEKLGDKDKKSIYNLYDNERWTLNYSDKFSK